MEANPQEEPDKSSSSSSSQPPAHTGSASESPHPLPAPSQPEQPTASQPAAAVPATAGKNNGGKPEDKLCWCSTDGLVRIEQKVRGAGRFPPHDYPVIVLVCQPKKGSRIRQLAGGGALEIMLAHNEIEEYLKAVAAAEGKVRYEVSRRVAPKDPGRRAYWDRINAARHQRRSPGEDGAQGVCY